MKITSMQDATALLLKGGVGVLPTDTVYGLVARAADQQAVERVYRLKHRENKPGTIIAADITQLVELGIKKRYLSAVDQYWPNPLSIIIPTGTSLAYLHQGKDSLAIRIPDDEAVRQILQQTGPLLTSSANYPGETPATTVAEAETYFHDTIDFYVEGGDLSGRESSTVIRIVDDAIEILREGALKIDEAGNIIK